jgi:hypothetical protein
MAAGVVVLEALEAPLLPALEMVGLGWFRQLQAHEFFTLVAVAVEIGA